MEVAMISNSPDSQGLPEQTASVQEDCDIGSPLGDELREMMSKPRADGTVQVESHLLTQPQPDQADFINQLLGKEPEPKAQPQSDHASLSPAAKGCPLNQSEIDWLRAECKRNFYFFAKFVLDFLFEESWLQPHIHKPICDSLQDYEKNRRMCVTLPRTWLKSTVCTIYFPIWRAIRDPNVRILIVQNSAPNAEKKLAAIRGQFESNPLLRILFPEILPDSSCVWTTKSACIKRSFNHPESTFETAGTRTKVISRHYDLIVEDDTVAPDLDELGDSNVVPTKDDIDQAIGWHRLALGLLTDPKRSQIIIVGTRWFEKDLISWNAANERHYLRIERAVRETDNKPDPNGEITYPERFDAETLEELKAGFGPYLFSCLYLNCPLRSDDMVFKKDWIKYYADPPRSLVSYTLVDPAGGGVTGKAARKAQAKSDPDYNVVLTIGKETKSGHLYVLEYTRFRGTPGRLINEIFRHQKTHDSLCVGIEAVQYQNALEYFVKEEMQRRNQWFTVEMLKSVKAKEVRIRALQPVFAAGSISVKSHHVELVAELEVFPHGSHDDVIDALSMVLQLLDITDTLKTTQDVECDNPMFLDGALHALLEGRKPDAADIANEFFRDPSADHLERESPWNVTTQAGFSPSSYGISPSFELSELF
jgi:predicted phage terminase large subunit-like protein